MPVSANRSRHQYYKLPADAEERQRQGIEHDMLIAWMGSLYCQPTLVQSAILRPESKILDIGAGTGRWAVQMALKFPDTLVVGIDITDVDFTQYVFQSRSLRTLSRLTHGQDATLKLPV